MNIEEPRKPRVFVLMPFDGDNFTNTYENAIYSACKENGTLCTRVDKEVIFDRISEAIYNQIDRADILIADVTGLNPNVYYEIGFAHGLGKNVIFIKDVNDPNKFPFDTQDFQHIVYTDSDHLKIELKRRLERFINNPDQNIWKSDFHKRRQQRFVPKIYHGFNEAVAPIANLIGEHLDNDSQLHIKLLGMACHMSFPLIVRELEDKFLVKKPKNIDLKLEIAVVSDQWLERYDGLIHSDWIERLQNFELQFAAFAKKARGRFSIELYRFHHLPYLHGILINENHLFLGSASWDRHTKFKVGGNAYEEYNDTTLAGDRKIEQYIGWFKYCCKEHEFFKNQYSDVKKKLDLAEPEIV